MDIDINRPMPKTKIYEINGIKFRGSSPNQIIADKLSVISTNKVFYRIKDVIDLYYISKVFEFDEENIRLLIKLSNRELGDFDGFLNKAEELSHSFKKFRFDGSVNKPTFDEIYSSVILFIKDILPKNK